MQSGILGSSKGETELPVKSDNAETRAGIMHGACILMSKHVIIHYASPRMNSAGVHLLYFKWKCRLPSAERKVGLSVAFVTWEPESADELHKRILSLRISMRSDDSINSQNFCSFLPAAEAIICNWKLRAAHERVSNFNWVPLSVQQVIAR
jgi:hypothetical protein